MKIKRVFSFLLACVLIAALSLTSYAAITVGENGVIYSDLPEPSPNGDSCAFAFTVDNNGKTDYYLMSFQIIRVVNSTVQGEDTDLDSGKFVVYESGNVSTFIDIDLSAPSITFRASDGDKLLNLVFLTDSLHMDLGFYCYLQLYDLRTNSISSYGSIESYYQWLKTYNWKVTSWKAYGNCIVSYSNFTSGTDYPQMKQMPIAWNNSYTDLDVVNQLQAANTALNKANSSLNQSNSTLDDINAAIGFEDGDWTFFQYLEDQRMHDVLVGELYIPQILNSLKSQDSHAANIDDALNGSGNSYAASDKSTIEQYDELEKSLNSDFSGDFSTLVGSINMNDFANSFQFWRNSFNSLIINPGNNIGYILTSFITFALLLGLVIFILGKRG